MLIWFELVGGVGVLGFVIGLRIVKIAALCTPRNKCGAGTSESAKLPYLPLYA